jgi:uncharacterized OsmC-like protein/REP element-mobilizing transposase RayT
MGINHSSKVEVYLHFVWATWDRLPLLVAGVRERVYLCMREEAARLKAEIISIGGIEDHVHVLLRLPSTISIAELVKQLKGSSSHLANHEVLPRGFKWQGGYSAGSVSRRLVPVVRNYVLHQEEHHREGTTALTWGRRGGHHHPRIHPEGRSTDELGLARVRSYTDRRRRSSSTKSTSEHPRELTMATNNEVVIRAGREKYRTEIITAGGQTLVADEPVSVGGAGGAPTPYDLLLGAVGSCTAMTLRMYADRKGWPLESVTVRLRTAENHAKDCVDCVDNPVGMHQIEREVELEGDLDAEQRERLMLIADRCPVKQTIERGIRVVAAQPA